MTATIPATDTITSAQFRSLLEADPELRVIDVRTGGEFETVHIPGSYNIPLDTLGEHVRDLADVEHHVVLVCQSGGRGSQAHSKLVGAGKHRLHILAGGMNAWQEEGGEVTHGENQRWALDRQVRLGAGALIIGAVALSAVVPGAQWVAAAMGLGLIHSSVTNSCVVTPLVAKLPYNRTDACDIASVLDDLAGDAA